MCVMITRGLPMMMDLALNQHEAVLHLDLCSRLCASPSQVPSHILGVFRVPSLSVCDPFILQTCLGNVVVASRVPFLEHSPHIAPVVPQFRRASIQMPGSITSGLETLAQQLCMLALHSSTGLGLLILLGPRPRCMMEVMVEPQLLNTLHVPHEDS